MHPTIRGALKRDVRLPLHVVQTVFAVAVVKVFTRVAAVGDRPVSPRTPRTHQVLHLGLVGAHINVGRVVKLGHVHVRADAVRVLRAGEIFAPETLTIQRLHRGGTVTNVSGTHWNAA